MALQTPPDYSRFMTADIGAGVDTYLARQKEDRQAAIQQGQFDEQMRFKGVGQAADIQRADAQLAIQQAQEDRNMELFTTKSRFMDMWNASQEALQGNPEQQNQYITKRIEDGQAQGQDMTESIDALNMTPEQRVESFQNLTQIGEAQGFLKAPARAYTTKDERDRALAIKELRLKQQGEEILSKAEDRDLERLERQERNLLNREIKREALEVRKTQNAVNKQIAEDKRTDRLDKETARNMQNLSKLTADNQSSYNNIAEIEKQIGFPLESYDMESHTAQGKDVDIPGTSNPILGRVYIPFKDVDQNFKASATKLFNIVLKNRSGAAVTSSEMKRLKTEFGEGRFANEAQLVEAMKRFKAEVVRVNQDIEAGFTPDVIDAYRSRGGRTSQDMLNSQKVIVVDGDGAPANVQPGRDLSNLSDDDLLKGL